MDGPSGVNYTDFGKLAQRVAQLESFQNQTTILVAFAMLLAGIALGFIWAKYHSKEQKKPSAKW